MWGHKMRGIKDVVRAISRGFMGRLAKDVRGNTLAIMAGALLPLAGMVGGGIDISRLYITKTRLQHGCDAGALAGRKAMGGGTWAQSNGRPNTTALQFFDANFQSQSYGSNAVTRSFSENAGKVTGTATVTVPMTLLKIFGKQSETITVQCDAEEQLPNTDIMFVLDTTGSMASIPTGDTQTKIDSLKDSVKCFYEIVARLDTDASCTTGTPSGGTGAQTQIRFGFVPYATNVNVGKLLPTAWFADSWNYQTREAVYTAQTNYTFPTAGNPTVTSTSDSGSTTGGYVIYQVIPTHSSSECTSSKPADTSAAAGPAGAPYSFSTTTSGSTQTTTYRTDTTYTSYSYKTSYKNTKGTKTCTITRALITFVRTTYYSRTDAGTATTTQKFSSWHYAQLPVNVGLLKNGTDWNDSFQWPIGPSGTNVEIGWDGCVEERQTVWQSSYSPIPSGAKDLDLDSVPVAGDVTTQWKPVLPGLIQTRAGATWTLAQSTTALDYGNGSYYACPVEAKKMQTWPDAAEFDDYVDQLNPEGNTYHDIGLIWGARLLSPTGIFASENALTPQGGVIERHMIFMTDGDACTDPGNYTAYGVNWYDRRQTDPSLVPTGGCTTTGTMTAQVNARTEALCTAIKNKNITLWVVTFGYVDPNTVTRMTACASSGKYFSASNAAALQSAFASIADQISALRLTR